jgi:hypothetical protein
MMLKRVHPDAVGFAVQRILSQAPFRNSGSAEIRRCALVPILKIGDAELRLRATAEFSEEGCP